MLQNGDCFESSFPSTQDHRVQLSISPSKSILFSQFFSYNFKVSAGYTAIEVPTGIEGASLSIHSILRSLYCFEYDEKMIGYIKGYRRVFYQANTDHRGTAESPGRVVTLESKEGAVTWGAAYRISGDDQEKLVQAYLDLREQEYDQKEYVNLYTGDDLETPTLCNVLVYIGSSDKSRNKFWAGPAPLEVMAKQIARAVGPSGPNYEYLFHLEQCLHELDCVDEDICELAEAVRKHLNSSNGLNAMVGIAGRNLITETVLKSNHMTSSAMEYR